MIPLLKALDLWNAPNEPQPTDAEMRAQYDRFCADLKRAPLDFTPEAQAALRRHHWPGNVRELRNAVERAVLLCEGSAIGRMSRRFLNTCNNVVCSFA